MSSTHISMKAIDNGWAVGAQPCAVCRLTPAAAFQMAQLGDQFAIRCPTPWCTNERKILEQSAQSAVAAWNAGVLADLRDQEAAIAKPAPVAQHWLMTIQDQAGLLRNVTSTDTPARELLMLNAAGVSVLLLFAMLITKDEYDGFNPPPDDQVQPRSPTPP